MYLNNIIRLIDMRELPCLYRQRLTEKHAQFLISVRRLELHPAPDARVVREIALQQRGAVLDAAVCPDLED